MGLINGDRVNVVAFEETNKVLIGKPLRRHEQQPHVTRANLLCRFSFFGDRQGAVDANRLNSDLFERVDLIFHQSQQRGHDDSESTSKNSRGLVAQRLASARRHDNQRVATLQYGRDRGMLRWTQAIEPPRFLQQLKKPLRDYRCWLVSTRRFCGCHDQLVVEILRDRWSGRATVSVHNCESMRTVYAAPKGHGLPWLPPLNK